MESAKEFLSLGTEPRLSLISEGINSLITVDDGGFTGRNYSDDLDTFRQKSRTSIEGPGGTPDQADASMYSVLLTEELQQIISDENNESDLITLADIEIEEKSVENDSSLIGIEQQLILETRRQASTALGPTRAAAGARMNNYIIDEEDSDHVDDLPSPTM